MMEVKKLTFSYAPGKTILEQIAFDTQQGECTAVLGNNGAGKSTLIKCLNRILQPRDGMVSVDGKQIQTMKRQDIAKYLAYVAQKNESDRFTVYDAVLLGRKPYITLNATKEDHSIVSDILEKMNLKNYALRYLDELSGGELQKVMLARALAQQPSILMLDEPTSSLDLKNQYEVLGIVREIAASEKISVIMVIHDLNLALRYCDKFLFVKDCKVFAYGGREVMNERNISEVYGIKVARSKVHGVDMIVPFPQDEEAFH
jgi:iron complex transport system ATP-binding protein